MPPALLMSVQHPAARPAPGCQGAGCPRTARRATWTAVGIAIGLELVAMVGMLALRNKWALLFTGGCRGWRTGTAGAQAAGACTRRRCSSRLVLEALKPNIILHCLRS